MTDAAIGRFDPVRGRAGSVSVTLTDLTYRETNKGRR
jgi:hypothetical protein